MQSYKQNQFALSSIKELYLVLLLAVPIMVGRSSQSQTAKEIHSFLSSCSSPSQRQFCPILKRGADPLFRTSNLSSSLSHRQFCPILNRGADQLCSLSSVLLLAVPEAVSSHTKARSRSPVHFIPCVAPRCPRGSLVPYESEEQISFAVHSLCCSSLSQRQSRPIQK